MIYLSHLFDDRDMKELLKEQPMGIETIEFSIGYCLDQWQERLGPYRSRLEELPHAALSVHGPFLDLNPSSNDSLIREASRQRFQQAYDAAGMLGARKLICHSCFVPQTNYREGWVDLTVSFWKEFLADKDGSIPICLENVFDPAWDMLLEVVRQVDHPAFSICLDLGHAYQASRIPLTEWIDALGDHIGHIHIHDNDGIRDCHLAVGDGKIPWKTVLPALIRRCPRVDYTVENAAAEDARKTLRYLRDYGIL